LIVSYWESETHFQQGKNSPEFIEGSKRGFEDMAIARKESKRAPMSSNF
jgi:heme oxygenase (mycobilin-producing)